MKKGIDLSKWNGKIDFGKVKEDGIEFVLLREGYGFNRDPMFLEYARQCLNRDIPIVGVYHFSYALTKAEAKIEADKTIASLIAADLDDHKDLVVFFDYEYDSVTYATNQGKIPTKKICTELTKAFCDRISALGFRPGVYYNIDFERNWYEPGFLDQYPGWVADWRKGATHNDVMLHQYDSKGVVAGINGPVDMNWLYDVKMEVEPAKEIHRIACEVLAGKWGNGAIRKIRLTAAGYNAAEVQAEVNRMLGL